MIVRPHARRSTSWVWQSENRVHSMWNRFSGKDDCTSSENVNIDIIVGKKELWTNIVQCVILKK